MSEILKKIKSVFIVEDENTATSKAKNTTPDAAPSTPASVATSAPTFQVSDGKVNEKFAEILFTAIEQNNQPGFDYFEFKQALRNLNKMAMDEGTKFQSAYAMAQAMGATPQKLIESAKFYLQVLAGEQSKFNEAHLQQRARLIGNREEEIRKHEAAIQQKTEQIQMLTQQIEEHRAVSEKIRAEIQESTLKIENTKADFEATFVAVAGQLQEDIQKMQSYLK